MTRPTISARFAAAVEETLASLPGQQPDRANAARPHLVRVAVVTLVLLAVVVPLGVLAVLAPRGGRIATDVATSPAPAVMASPAIASCDAARLQPFGCDTWEVNEASSRFGGYEAWFEIFDGSPRFVVGESENFRSLPVTLDDGVAVGTPVPAWSPEQRGCDPDSQCGFDLALRRVATAGARITRSGSTLRITGGGTTLTGVDSHRAHTYAQVGVDRAGAHVLLTYRDNGMHMDAADEGRLSLNASGCLTDGYGVLVLPDTTVLHADGSIDIAGRHVPLGGRLHLGGGEGPVPADQRCGTGPYWYGWGA